MIQWDKKTGYTSQQTPDIKVRYEYDMTNSIIHLQQPDNILITLS